MLSNLSSLRTTANRAADSPRASVPGHSAVSAGAQANAPAKKPASSGQDNTVARPVTDAPGPDELERLVSEMQRKTATFSSDLQFSVDKETGKDVIKVTDRKTRDIVWQFPSEEALQITKALDQYQKGLLLSRRA